MSNDKTLYDPIQTKHISKNNWVAYTKCWIEGDMLNGKIFKISVEQLGETEQEAKDKLLKFLSK